LASSQITEKPRGRRSKSKTSIFFTLLPEHQRFEKTFGTPSFGTLEGADYYSVPQYGVFTWGAGVAFMAI
jgi:hypothetical protein